MDQTTRLYQIRRTCCEMLADRGYLVGDDDLKMPFDEFKQRFAPDGGAVAKDRLTLLQQHRDDPSRRVIVFFPEASKVGVKEIKEMAEKMREEAVHRAVLVVASNLTPFARSVVADMGGKVAMEVFTEPELLVNVTKHMLVPSHRVLTADEKATLLARYKVQESQLPRIQLSDPVARYYGLERGQVVRIVRPSETAGRYVTYRWCV
jgi:DNA-directed RNA polymerase I, II, and III subunit RPABC1